MPPKRGIVKSGNAGNSKSSGASASKPTTSLSSEDTKPLFPPGSKYPLSLLHERCQKAGWEKPVVDTYKHDQGWAFAVTLSRISKKTSQKESVRFQPHPPYYCPGALEARHWGATYALYRFCNNIQLNRVLPPGPREYWQTLADEHKAAPEHLAWQYNPDPFQAKKEVEERQEKAAQTHQERASGPSNATTSPEFADAPEVKMASSIRDSVESAIKKAYALFPEVADAPATSLTEEEVAVVVQQLSTMGFKPAQVRKAQDFVTNASTLFHSMRQSLSSLEAAIEYLLLHVPECDLPQRFLPNKNTDSFITSGHSGKEDIKKRWVLDKATKEAGWPLHCVQTCLQEERLIHDWKLLLVALDKLLIGDNWKQALSQEEEGIVYTIDRDEVTSLGADISAEGELIFPLFTAPLRVHILLQSPEQPKVDITRPSIYLTSDTIPPYLRLHLLSVLLTSLGNHEVESEESFLMATMRILESTFAKVEDEGPPSMEEIMKPLLPAKALINTGDLIPEDMDSLSPSSNRGKRGLSRKQRDPRSKEQVQQGLQQLMQRPEYQEVLEGRKKLPAYQAKGKFLELVRAHQVVVVVGDTGCGKTTQLPQHILDDSDGNASIVVTQPRRISAISIAARVSSERLEDGSVGYAIRGESKQTNQTKLLFCTTGVILRRLSTNPDFTGVTHIIVDEVHERSVDSDILLAELKNILVKNKSLKVILMSATINHHIFVKYFGDAPLLSIPGRTHPVKDLYLEDIIQALQYTPNLRPSPGSEKLSKSERDEFLSRSFDDKIINAIETIQRADATDYQLVASLVQYITRGELPRGGILIFLSGAQEIQQCITAIRQIVDKQTTEIYPLHANLTSDDQRRVFVKTSKWKIICATNVAETSITIDGILYVIDTGKAKENQYDPVSGLCKLVEMWTTRAAAQQRRGRAGRTQPGTCYKLYTKRRFEGLRPYPIPEVLRMPLENILLNIKSIRPDENVKGYLRAIISPPELGAVEAAWSTLQEIGAFEEDGQMTALGKHMSLIPVDVRIAKMLVLATMFRCLDPILTVAACLSAKPLFLNSVEKRDDVDNVRRRFTLGNSDLLTDMNAYSTLRSQSKGSSMKQLCEENFISPTAIREITVLRQELASTLTDLGFVSFSLAVTSPILNSNSENVNLLRAIILGGLWPNAARVHLPESAIKFDKVQAGTIRRENSAQDFKMYDLQSNARVFLHPSSILFSSTTWRSPIITYFTKHVSPKSDKVFLRGVTEVPLYGLLMFGGNVAVNHIGGGLVVGNKQRAWVKLKAFPRIGVLVNQLRRLLDVQLQQCIETNTVLNFGDTNPMIRATLLLLADDGLSESI